MIILEIACWIFFAFSLILCLPGIGVGFFLFLAAIFCLFAITLRKCRKGQTQPTTNIDLTSDSSCTTESAIEDKVDESSANYDLFYDVYENSLLCYEYEENMCLNENAATLITGHGGECLEFLQEPENEHDKNAVAIYHDKTKIGYVYKGKIQDMINDWIVRKDFFTGYINKIFITDNKATYKIGFYKPLDSYEHKTFTLTKTKKKIDDTFTREDNLCTVEEGDEVSIEYDSYLDSYIVYNCSYEEIGELGSGATTFIENSDYEKIIGIVTDYSFNDNGSPKLKITVYLIN